MHQTLIESLKRQDKERWLSILWAPVAARPGLLAVHAYDLEQQRVVADARDAMLAEIRLAWWREQLEQIGSGKPAQAQPILLALAADAGPRAVDLAALSRIEDGLRPLLADGPLVALDIAQARGAPLFQALLTACVGRPPTSAEAADAAAAGTRWALARLWRGGWGQSDARLAALEPPVFPAAPLLALPTALRVLDAWAASDWARLVAGRPLQPVASAHRQWIMLRAALRRG